MKKIKLQLLSLVLLLTAASSNAQFVRRWTSVLPNVAGSSPAKDAVLVAADGNIIAAGVDKIIKYTPGGTILWTADVPHGFPANALAMASDKAGNIYVTPTRTLGQSDIHFFVAKYNSAGQQVWFRTFNGPGQAADEAAGIGIDQSGNVYISGTSFFLNSSSEIFTAKLNNDGVLQWSKSFDPGFSSEGNAMAVDFFTGDVYAVGRSSVPKDGDVSHRDDFTTIKYNTNGEQQWVNLYNGSLPDFAFDEAKAIALDADGNVIVTGFSSEKIESDFFAGTTMITTFKYDRRDGSEIWNKKFGNDQADGEDFFESKGLEVAIDGNEDVIVIGASASSRWHTIKYRKSDARTLWTKEFDNDQFDTHSGSRIGFDIPSNIAFDQQNNVYVTGSSRFNDTGDDIFTIKYRASDGNQLGSARFDNDADESGADITVDARGNAYVVGGSNTSIVTVSYGVCAIICPQNITVNNEPGKCGSIVKFEARTTGNCGDLVFLDGQDTVSSDSFFTVGIHSILVKSPSTEETCSFTITVIDNEKPVITESPASLTVSCAADVPLPNISLVKATDNCGIVTISHAGDIISNQTCANRFTLTRTYKATDSHGNTATSSQVITVNDNIPPRITNFSLSKESLFPPNHKMQDITLNYQVFDNCVSSPLLTVSVSSNEPVNGTGDGDTDPDWLVIDPHHIQLRAERSAIGNGRIYTITVTADDGCNPSVTVTKQVFVAHNITGPKTGNPFRIGSTVSLNGIFWDKPGNKHTAKWLLDGSIASNGTVVEPSGNQNGNVGGSYKFNSAGVYKMQMNVIDQSGGTSYANTNGDLEAIVVIFDPNGGNVYGGGWYNSPAGALTGKPSATGKASYGFAVNYKNATKPQGETQFEFKSESFEFNAVNFDYLAVNGATAQFKGTGKITGGQSGIGFIMTVSDGALDGSNADKIRMKIYNRNTGAVIYDNQPGASDAALPGIAVGTNSVIVIQGSNVNATVTNTKQENLTEEITMVNGLTVSAYPNPSRNYFTISVNSNNKDEIMLQVYDQNGRIMDVRRNMIPGSVIRFGDKYVPGAYYARIMQGKEHKEIKLIKVPD